ncbi:MAG: hypothetical protein ACI4RP_00230 [Acutalibacteraceae bacterium]
MNHIERRDKGLPYISDKAVFEQQKLCRRLTLFTRRVEVALWR